MGKKSKGNKLAKMSEEERARYLQLRADIEEEARRRKIQLIALYMKVTKISILFSVVPFFSYLIVSLIDRIIIFTQNKLKREEAFCRLNMAKINQEWRCILRKLKCQELRNEIMNMRKYCDNLLQHKENVIKRLLNDLELAHGQHDTAKQSHLEMLQKFISECKQNYPRHQKNKLFFFFIFFFVSYN